METAKLLTQKQFNVFEGLLKELNISDYTVQLSPALKPGENFMGCIIQADVKKNGGTSAPLRFIIKCIPSNEHFCTITPANNCFQREIYMYSKVFPEFLALQNKQNISPFNLHPTCYKYLNLYREEMLIFKNMKFEGFTHYPRTQCLDYNHVLLILKGYAQFHALSYAIQDQNPDLFKEISNHMEDTFFEKFKTKVLQNIVLHRHNEALKSISLEKGKPVYNRYHQFINNMIPKITELLQARTSNDVICHIDCGIPNFLFKYKYSGTSREPSEVCILDFQMSRLSSPAVDLTCLLFSATNKTARAHYDELILKYYKYLCDFLTQLGSDGTKLLPFNVLQDHLKEYGIMGLFWAVLILYVQSSEFTPDVFEDKRSEEMFIHDLQDRSVFDKRVRDSILDFDKFGYKFN